MNYRIIGVFMKGILRWIQRVGKGDYFWRMENIMKVSLRMTALKVMVNSIEEMKWLEVDG
jgi:hypothetical protein